MNRLLACLCLTTLVGCSPKTPPVENWLDWSDGNLAVKLPSEPSVEPQSVDSPLGKLEFKVVSCKVGKRGAFMLTKIDYPVDPAAYNADRGLEGAVNGAVSNVQGNLESSKVIEHKGLPGREIVVSAKQGDVFVRAQMHIDPQGPSLYQLQAIGDKAFTEEPVVDRFFSTLNITPK